MSIVQTPFTFPPAFQYTDGFQNVVTRDAVDILTVGIGVQLLKTYKIPANSMDADGKKWSAIIFGNFNGAAGNKRLLIDANGSSIILDTTLTGAVNNNNFVLRINAIRLSLTSIIYNVDIICHPFGVASGINVFAGTVIRTGMNLSVNNPVNISAEVANAADSVEIFCGNTNII